MDNKKELVEQIASFNPLTDTGRAIKFLLELKLQEEREREAHEARMVELGKTIDLSAAESRDMVAKLTAAWEAEHKAAAPKRDFFDALLSGFGQFVAEWNAKKEARKKKS